MTEGDETGEHRGLSILLADEDEGALRVTAGLVRGLGHVPAEIAVDVVAAAETIARDDPDLSIVVLDRDDEHALDLIEEIAAYARGERLRDHARGRNRTVVDVAASVAEGHALLPKRGE